MKLKFSLALLALAAFASSAVQARSNVHFSIGVNYPAYPVYVAPAPVYYAPAPVYYAPAPVYYARPAPVYYVRPAPVYYGGVVYHGHRHGHKHRHGHRGGH